MLALTNILRCNYHIEIITKQQKVQKCCVNYVLNEEGGYTIKLKVLL